MKATKFSQFLQNREELKFVDRPHWIYILEATIWSFIILMIGVFSHSFISEQFIIPRLQNNIRADGILINAAAYIATAALWGSVIIAIIYFLNRLAFWASTYIFSSDRRLYMKTGIIRVLVNEVSFEEIRKTDINYGLLGRFIGYGKMMMDARFVKDTELPYIYHPEKFAKIIHHENDLVNDVNLSYVTGGNIDEANKIVQPKEVIKDQVPPMRKQMEFAEYAFSQKERDALEEDHQDDVSKDFDHAVFSKDASIDKPAKPSLLAMD